MDSLTDIPLIEEPAYPFQQLLGFGMTGWKENWARFELPLRETFNNRHGIPHGGIYAAMLDTVMGYAGCYTGDLEKRRTAITLSLTTNYLSRPKGSILIAEGWRTGGGNSTYFAEGRISDETGEILAQGNAVFRYRKGAATQG
ncbi:uncharacterized protein (TIGR00369 family) [Breoghania corrubedonensis]|uniref:Uncharacterized protein (TIGR00369 family) n=1 Tax=Breoghania corrubedonensis TaxID=665038 RepID=A0A2T5US57_9HYPH|nr:PaaI family thioesterase [Breoghania corrubedonensis]PTW54349.1 uncharacterized protein (TIGR00369 family) [Breoghania corrubedonensis]